MATPKSPRVAFAGAFALDLHARNLVEIPGGRYEMGARSIDVVPCSFVTPLPSAVLRVPSRLPRLTHSTSLRLRHTGETHQIGRGEVSRRRRGQHGTESAGDV